MCIRDSGDLIHAEEDVVPDHILKPVGQQAGEVNGYFLSGLGLGIHVQGVGCLLYTSKHQAV